MIGIGEMETAIQDEIEIKVVLVGDTGVGKTCVVKQATTGSFESDTCSTLGAAYSTKFLKIDGYEAHLQIWDTAGQERYRGMTPMYYRGASAIILVFSLIDSQSFERLDDWLTSIEQSAEPGVQLFLVGNKVDLEDDRTISQETAEQRASSVGASYCEVSAKTGYGVNDLFYLLCKTIIEKGKVSNTEINLVDVSNGVKPVKKKRFRC